MLHLVVGNLESVTESKVAKEDLFLVTFPLDSLFSRVLSL